MSLRALHRISCSIVPSACGCKTMSVAQFCTPATKRVALTARKIPMTTGSANVRMLSSGPESEKSEDKRPLTFKEKVTNMWKNYGRLAIGTYIGVYIGTLGSIFFALDFDIFNAATFGFDHSAAIAKVNCVLSCYKHGFSLICLLVFLWQVCDIYESVSGRTDLPLYMKQNPTGYFVVCGESPIFCVGSSY